MKTFVTQPYIRAMSVKKVHLLNLAVYIFKQPYNFDIPKMF